MQTPLEKAKLLEKAKHKKEAMRALREANLTKKATSVLKARATIRELNKSGLFFEKGSEVPEGGIATLRRRPIANLTGHPPRGQEPSR